MEVRVSHGAPRRGASDDPSGASAGRPAPLTRTVGPHPPRPEPVGVGGEVGYLASTLHALPSTRFRWVSDRKNAGSRSKGPSVSKKAEKASLLKRAGRAPPHAMPRYEGVRGRLYRRFSGSVDLWLDRKKVWALAFCHTPPRKQAVSQLGV